MQTPDQKIIKLYRLKKRFSSAKDDLFFTVFYQIC